MEREDQIIKLVCDYLTLPIENVISKSRKHKYCEARQMISYLLGLYTKMSLNNISKKLLYKSHAGAWRDIKMTKNYLDIDKRFTAKFKDLLINAEELAKKLDKEITAKQSGYKFEQGDICWFWNDSPYLRFPILGTFERSYLNEDSVNKFVTREYPAFVYSYCVFAGERILPEIFRNKITQTLPIPSDISRSPVLPNHCLI